MGCKDLVLGNLLANDPADSKELYAQVYLDADCKGQVYPSEKGSVVTSPLKLDSPVLSMVIPSGWEMQLAAKDGTKTTFQNNTGGSVVSTMEPKYVEIVYTKRLLSQDEFKAALCMGLPPTQFGYDFKTAYYPTSNQCDTFMPTYCSNSLYSSNPECDCFTGAVALKEKYPSLNLPVVCFDPKCYANGYQTFLMGSQQCTAPICQSIIIDAREKFTKTGTSKVECGPREFTIPDLTTPTPVPEATANIVTYETPLWVYVAGAFGLLAGIILIFMLAAFV